MKGRASNSPEGMLWINALLAQFTEAQRQVAQAEFEAEKLRSEIEMHKALKKTPTLEDVPDTALTPMLESDPLMKSKLMQITNLERMVIRMDAGGMRPDDPTWRQFAGRLYALQKEVD